MCVLRKVHSKTNNIEITSIKNNFPFICLTNNIFIFTIFFEKLTKDMFQDL